MRRKSMGKAEMPSSRRRIGTGTTLLACLLLAGCTGPREYIRNGFKVGPNYRKPAAATAETWLESTSKKVSSDHADLTAWWTVFGDPVLNDLVETAYRQNLDLRTAGTRILEARAVRNIAAGNLFPQQQQATGDFTHVQASRNTANKFPNLVFDNWSTGFNLSWEIDFWGRFRRAVESADANLDSTVETYDDVLVLLVSDVASNYVQIRTFQERLVYARENVKIQQSLLKQAEDRAAAGVDNKLDISQLRSNLRQTEALIPDLLNGQRLANNRLCLLLGIPPTDLVPDLGDRPIPTPPGVVALGVPADLLRRRPDVRRAERNVAAASAAIGVATADLYPRFALLGTIGWEAEKAGNLITPGSVFGSIGPSMRWDILNYGRLLNNIRVQDARWQGNVFQYQNTVLRAGKEVEDALSFYLRSLDQVPLLQDSSESAAMAVDIVQQRSKDIKFDVNRIFTTTNFLVQTKDQYAVTRGNVALALIQIYRSLGGGWEIRRPNQVLVGAVSVEPEPLRNGKDMPMKIEGPAPGPGPKLEGAPPALLEKKVDRKLLRAPTESTGGLVSGNARNETPRLEASPAPSQARIGLPMIRKGG